MQATPFQLQDQFGQSVSLSDFSGKVVALTFLYTNCPDVCPLTTEALRKTYETLGSDVSKVAFVAITVDPARDTVQQVFQYSRDKEMLERWHFLTGSVEELEPVWQGYFVAADPYLSGEGGATEFLTQATLAQRAKQAGLPAYLITHQAPVYLIDGNGQIRVLHSDVTLDTEPLVKDLRLLVKSQR